MQPLPPENPGGFFICKTAESGANTERHVFETEVKKQGYLLYLYLQIGAPVI